MITNYTPEIRREFAAANKADCHLHIGKFAKLTSNGEIALIASGSETPDGLVIAVDSPMHVYGGGETSGTLLMHTFGGIVEVQLGASHGQILPGSKLTAIAGGCVRLSQSGETVHAIAIDPVPTVQAGQLVRAVMVAPGSLTA